MCTLALTCAHLNHTLHLLLFSGLCLSGSAHLQQLSLPVLATTLRTFEINFCEIQERKVREDVICKYHVHIIFPSTPKFCLCIECASERVRVYVSVSRGYVTIHEGWEQRGLGADYRKGVSIYRHVNHIRNLDESIHFQLPLCGRGVKENGMLSREVPASFGPQESI